MGKSRGLEVKRLGPKFFETFLVPNFLHTDTIKMEKSGDQKSTSYSEMFQRGVINICCNLVVVRGIFSCPPRTDERAVCNELS